jgi:hypothetical protein
MVAILGTVGAAIAQDASDTATTAPSQAAQNAQAIQPAQDNSELVSEVEQLRSEVDRLKQQVAALNQIVEQLQTQQTPAPAEKNAVKTGAKPAKKKTVEIVPTPAPASATDDRATKTVLVFHDGHKVEATNYAIVGQTLWIYTETDSKKMPLSDLDVTATKTANSDRGITFQVPPTK